MLLVLSIAWAATVALLIGRAVRQYGAYQQLTPSEPKLNQFPPLAVIAPARNEARNIVQFLGSLLAQDYPAAHIRFVLVNDNSTDDTGALARAFSDPRLTVIDGAPLPPGWKGKPYACWQASQTISDEVEWLCFIDCDTRPMPRVVRCAVARAEREKLDLLSLEPFQILGSFWERVIFPAGFLLLAFSQDLRRVNDPDLPDAFANGQFILLRRKIYESISALPTVRNSVADDTALARAVKSSGHRIAVLGAEKLIATRMYHNLAELWEGLGKVLIEMIGGAGKTIFFAAVGVALAAATIGLPIWGWLNWTRTSTPSALLAALVATAASLAMFGVHIGCAVYVRIPFAYGLLFPLGYLMGAPLTVYSFISRARGKIAWKGRVYATAGNVPSPDAPGEG